MTDYVPDCPYMTRHLTTVTNDVNAFGLRLEGVRKFVSMPAKG